MNAELYTRARAAENRVFLLTSNRYDRERWAEFCGWSQICGPSGDRLAEAGAKGDTLLVAEIDVEEARTKDILPRPGVYEMRLWSDRRPELYGALVEDPTAVTTT
jgi:predicted amidohydrolase